eukprot:3229230-Alexandrium_andersonii.AAC.1
MCPGSRAPGRRAGPPPRPAHPESPRLAEWAHQPGPAPTQSTGCSAWKSRPRQLGEASAAPCP